MKIEKRACSNIFRNETKFFSSARSALKNVLEAYRKSEGEYTLFLPKYIGISPNEGSGIYDPVIELGIQHVFYDFTEDLSINIEYLRQQMKIPGRKVFLFVHYFGYVDRNYETVLNMLRENDCFIIEDGAHALYTHLIDAQCGYGDCIIYSFHKMLPTKEGGAVRLTTSNKDWWCFVETGNVDYDFYNYDLNAIAKRRKQNAFYWEQLLMTENRVKIIRKATEYVGQTPQSFPILLLDSDRYDIYIKLNDAGFGAISLYHTMISPIIEKDDEIIQNISGSILNLPVHQDVSYEDINDMYSALITFLNLEAGIIKE